MDWEGQHRAFVRQREALDKKIRELERWMSNELLWKIVVTLEERKPSDFSYLPFVREVGTEKLLKTLLTSSDAWKGHTTREGGALFLICSLAKDEIAQSFLRWFYRNDKYISDGLSASLASLEREFLLMKRGRPHLSRYMEVLRAHIKLFGQERVLSSIPSSDEISGYIFAEVYRQGFPIGTIYAKIYSHTLGSPLFIIDDIVEKSPTPLTDAQYRELAIYALGHFPLRLEYKEVNDRAFHEALILNADVTELHPVNVGIRSYLEKIAPLEDQV